MEASAIEIREKIWKGSINIRVIFEHDTLDESKEYLLCVNRNSYLPNYFDELVHHFSIYVQEIKYTPIWLEYDGKALKWHVPVGVQYDWLRLASVMGPSADSVWTLNLKADAYPSDIIIPFIYRNSDGSVDYSRQVYEAIVNQLKQSCFVMNGTANPILKLSENDSNDLWESIKDCNFATFDGINSKIVPRKLQRVPMKIYIIGSPVVIHEPVYPEENGRPQTLLQVLERHTPTFFYEKSIASIYIQGINADSLLNQNELFITEIWDLFKHLDNFLYIVIMPKGSNT